MMKFIQKFSAIVLLTGVLFCNSCKKEKSCESCATNPTGNTNKPPTAIAGPDQVITLPTDSVSLNGSSSSDPDGIISSYLWTKISGPASSTIIKPVDSITKVKTIVAGIYLFELKVTDNGSLSAKDTVQVIVDNTTINQPPVANAGTDQIITLPTNTLLLNGSGSIDPENNIIIYLWTKISGPSTFSIVNANTAETQATNLIQGIYQFELKVTDAGGLFSKDTLQVTVNSMTSNNFSPIAHAGTDISVNYDLQTCSINPTSFTLNGTASTNPDGTIVSYLWTGPGVIASPNAAITNVSNITFGYNEFILKVTDNNGAIDTDTILVNVVSLMNRPLVPAQLIPIGTLSQSRSSFAVAAAGNKLVFAGGWINNGNSSPSSAKVDIYDISTGSWTTSQLSEGRFGIGVAVLGNKIFFGGGGRQQNNGWGSWQYGGLGSSVVDIFDVANNSWSTAQLSSPRVPVGTSAGNKVVFAGGDDLYGSSRVDVFDGISNTWTSRSLSESRHISQIAVSGNKIFLAGGSGGLSGVGGNGVSKKIDILDASTGVWSEDFLSFERGEMGAIGVNNMIYWGGGAVVATDNTEWGLTNSVEIRDLVTNTTSFKCLSEPKLGLTALKKDNKILFFGGGNNKFDIYDLSTGFWSIGVLSQNLLWSSIISYNNTLYVAGGEINGVVSNQVWKLEF